MLDCRRVLEAVKGFNRVKDYADMPMLLAALRARDRQLALSTAQEKPRILSVNVPTSLAGVLAVQAHTAGILDRSVELFDELTLSK